MVHHRNHLGILSANALTPSGGNYSYDFTTSFDKTYGETFGCKELAPGIWGMIGGDANCDGDINDPISVSSGNRMPERRKCPEDFNLDGQVDNKDKDDCWQPNIGERMSGAGIKLNKFKC